MSEASTTDKRNDARKLLSAARIAVRWSDMDANGHVNNATFFTYFEQVRIEWLERVGMQNTAEHEGPVVIKTSCTYLRPMPYPETLEVRMYGGSPARTSFPTYYAIFSAGDENLKYAEGDAIMVWTDRVSGASRPVSDALREILK